MQVVIKKNILFNFLKRRLSESRSDYTFYSDGSFLGRFEEEKEEKSFVNQDTPLAPDPRASFQLAQEKPDVSDPEYMPASKSGFLAAATAVLEHVPDRQIEFAYEKLHRLLDAVMEKEDEINYGMLEEAVLRIIRESSRSDELFQQAASMYAKGENYLSLINQIEEATPGMTRDDIEDKIADLALEIMSSQQSQPEAPSPEPQTVRTPVSGASGQVIRRRAKKPSPPPSVPSESEVEDLDARSRAEYDSADDKDAYMSGYNAGADDAAFDKPHSVPGNVSDDYTRGYSAGYKSLESDLSMASFQEPEPAGSSRLLDKSGAFDQLDIPEILKLIPSFFMLVQEIAYKIEKDRYNLMMSGDNPKDADKNVRQVYNIAHTETFIDHNLLKSYFNKDFALRSAKKHFDVIQDGRYNTPDTRKFKADLISAIAADKMTEEQAHNLFIKMFVEKILDDVANYNYEPDKNKKLENTLKTEFAATTVYKTGTAAGPGGTQRASAKPYQGNTSATFHRRVKEEYREEIISDFLDRLANKYLTGDTYRIPTGRKEPDNPSKSERYEFNPEEFRTAAEEYANSLIDKALADQQAVAQGKVLVPEDEEEPEPILGDEDSPDGMSDEEIAEKLSNTQDFQTLAPFFGFSAAPGMRQWFLKFAKRHFEMGLISAKIGDRSLLKFHSEMVEAVLETLNEGLASLLGDLVDSPDANSREKQELIGVLARATEQIQDAYEEFLDVGDELGNIFVSAKTASGEDTELPFLNTLGGQLTRSVNGMFFKKVLTKLDKSWTDYVAEQLQTNEQMQNYIADSISDAANIDAKAAKSLAEYFIGKKNAPIILKSKDGTRKIYRSEAEGNPTKGVRALMKYGIDAEAYEIIRAESMDWFEDMLMTDFARTITDEGVFEGQYRQMILKDYEKLKTNKNQFKKVILQALDDVIVGSSQRMAMSQLKDYEVQS